MKILVKNWCKNVQQEGWQIAFLPHFCFYGGKGPNDRNGYCLAFGWINMVLEFWWGDVEEVI